MKNRAKKYFLLASQYMATARLLAKTIIKSGNSYIGIGLSYESAKKESDEKIINSDVLLAVPLIFNSMQSVELYLKGLLLLNNIEISYTHEVTNLASELKQIYGENSNIYKSFQNFYSNEIIMIKAYRKDNGITTTKDLYESLRYPETDEKIFDHIKLKYNGKSAIKQYKRILKLLSDVNNNAQLEFNRLFENC